MSMEYLSTRGDKNKVTASIAILKGLADDGGLYTPVEIPTIDKELDELINLDYKDLAYEILKLYLTDFTEEELRYCINNAYDDKFDTELIAPVKKVDDIYFLELFHGKTLAFKDMALSILPYFMKVAMKKHNVNRKIAILTATSGDTGKAALEGFAGVDGIDVIVFYPDNGVSEVQKLQMVTQEEENTCVVGVNGNFDDTQTGVKNIFNDSEFNKELLKRNIVLSSANSINIGRLVPQTVYYFYAYFQMVKSKAIKMGEKINFTVPTGNFGNILAGYYAKTMGLPIDKLICASNANTVLYDFFSNKTYDRNRELVTTNSPSMDILISSNLERLLFHVTKDSQWINKAMNDLQEKGSYNLDKNINDIKSSYADDEESLAAIKEVFEKGYLMDTHTGAAYSAYKKLNMDIQVKNVIVSTASPYKFANSVLTALGHSFEGLSISEMFDKLSEITDTDIPSRIKDIDKKEIKHKMICDKEIMEEIVRAFV